MPISHTYRTLFVHIPRAAGSSIERSLGVFGRENDGANTPCPDILFGLSRGVQMQHLTIREIRAQVDERVFTDYFTFTFVRNPYDRIVSAWRWSEEIKRLSLRELLLDVFAPRKSRAMELYRARQEKRSFRGHRRRLTFREFLLKVASPNKEKPLESDLDRHFKSQWIFTADEDGTPLVDFVGRYENLIEDFGKVREILGLDADLPHLNATEREPYSAYYDEETRLLVADMYGRDLEMFGYRFEA